MLLLSVGALEHGMIKQIAARASARPDAAGRNFDAIPAERHGVSFGVQF
jgi:hypothetical protein